MILNASDDRPSTNVEVAKFAGRLLQIKDLKAVPISSLKSKSIKELKIKKYFYTVKTKLEFNKYNKNNNLIFENL